MQGGKSLGRVLAVVLSLLRHSDGWQCQGFVPKSLTQNRHQWMQLAAEPGDDAISSSNTSGRSQRRRTYDLGIGQNPPLRRKANEEETSSPPENPTKYWLSPKPVHRPRLATANATNTARPTLQTRRVLQTTTNQLDSKLINSALYNLEHFQPQKQENARPIYTRTAALPERPRAYYPDIDLSIPDTVYTQDGEIDLVWDLLRWEAYEQAQREPLLVSFLHSTILNHPSLESSLAFLLANRLQSPAMMISTQLQSLILEALEGNAIFRRFLRADIMAVRDRDPACNSLPDVFLYFKGFHALQSHRVAHCLWHNDKQVLALFLQSQVSQIFQIDIHPNATLGSGILVDHGTGVVIGSTVGAVVVGAPGDYTVLSPPPSLVINTTRVLRLISAFLLSCIKSTSSHV